MTSPVRVGEGRHDPADSWRRRASTLRTALLIRRAEEQLLQLFAAGSLTGTVHCCLGQEVTAAVLGELVEDGDTVYSNHRCHGHFLAVTGDLVGLFAEVMGTSAGVSGGRGGSQHLHSRGFSSGGILGGLVPVAAGSAMAHQRDRTDRIAIAFIGDGTWGEGVVYETLNLAAVWQLPLLVVVEDNKVAQSTPTGQTTGGRIDRRAEAFGIPVVAADVWDIDRLAAGAEQAVGRVRAGEGPLVLVVDSYRLAPHSKGDDHRDTVEIADYWRRDELRRLLAAGAPDTVAADRTAQQEVAAAVVAAQAAPPLEPSGVLAHPRPPADLAWRPAVPDGRRFVTAQQAAFGQLMASMPELLLLGEDIGDPYGGAFKATAGVGTRFPERVRNTPVSEAAIVGVGAGLAVGGYRVVVEIMFGDFLMLAMDQLVNQVAKLRSLYGLAGGGQLVVRTPMGGHRGYGPTHSQTLDRHLLGVPGLRVVALNSAVDPLIVYGALLSDGLEPAVVLENKLLYGRRLGGGLPDGFDLLATVDPLPVVRVEPKAPAEVSLIGYGGMLDVLLEAADQLFADHEVVARVVCPTQICPFDVRDLLPVLTTPAAVVAEEGQGFAGFGAEVVAQLAAYAPELAARTRRVSAVAVPIPASRVLERAVLPAAADVVRAAREVVAGGG